jgi:homocysteine S-methyltransferase
VEAFEKEVEGVLGEGTEWPALVLYPDGTRSGERYDSTLREWVVDEEGGEDGERPPEVSWHQEVGDVVEEARERGKWSTIVVGGCCRTGPEDIAMLRERFR